jgi:hypothetical protein
VTSLEKALRDFAQFAAKLKGDEKSEAPVMQSNGWSLRDLSDTLGTFSAICRKVLSGCELWRMVVRIREAWGRVGHPRPAWFGRLMGPGVVRQR